MTSQNLVSGEFVFFFGVVEDRNDPDKKRRVRVRCFGIHTADKTQIPTESLPWARVMIPGTESRSATTNVWEGSLVFGFFADGREKQEPIVVGIVPSMEGGGSPLEGFVDPRTSSPITRPDGSPRLYNNTTEFSPGSSPYADPSRYGGTIGAAAKGEPASSQGPGGQHYVQPSDPYAAVYPYNNVHETESGHVVELDDSSGAERIHIFHKAGTFIEIHPDGSIVHRTVSDSHKVTLKNSYELTTGDSTNITDGNHKARVGGTCDIEVQGNVTINVLSGNVDLTVNGDMTRTVSGNATDTIGGSYTVSAGGSMKFTAPTIDLN